jgi:hypothetical protein
LQFEELDSLWRLLAFSFDFSFSLFWIVQIRPR